MATLHALDVVDRLERDPFSVTIDELDAIDHRANVLAIIGAMFAVGSIGMLAAFTYRLYRTVPTYSTYPQRWRGGGAVDGRRHRAPHLA